MYEPTTENVMNSFINFYFINVKYTEYIIEKKDKY